MMAGSSRPQSWSHRALQSRQRTQTGPQALYKLSWITFVTAVAAADESRGQDRSSGPTQKFSTQRVLPLRGLWVRTEGDTFSCHNWEMLPHRLARGQSLLGHPITHGQPLRHRVSPPRMSTVPRLRKLALQEPRPGSGLAKGTP